MKTSKMLGAVALTAALAMGTMPAFAAAPKVATAPGAVGDDTLVSNVTKSDDGATNTGNADTTVWAQSYVPQLNVTIPIEMGVAFPAANGKIIFPSDTAYKIINNGENAVKVEEVKATQKGTFQLVNEITESTTPSTGMNAVFNITMKRTGVMETPIPVNAMSGTTAQTTQLNWTIDGASGTGSSTEQAVTFAGNAKYASSVDGSVFANDILEVALLSYTVSATVPTAGAGA